MRNDCAAEAGRKSNPSPCSNDHILLHLSGRADLSLSAGKNNAPGKACFFTGSLS